MMRVSEAEESFIDSNMAENGEKLKKLDFGDLEEVELDGGFAAEDGDEDLDLALGLVDGADSAQKVGKWPLDDLDGFAKREGGLELRCGLQSEGENGVNFFLGNWGRIIAGANEAGDALGGADGEPRIIGDNHLHEHVAGKNLFFDGAFLAFADFDLVLGGDENLVDVIGQTHGLNFGLEGVGGSGLMTGVGVDDVPLGAGGIVGVDDEMILIFFGHFYFIDL